VSLASCRLSLRAARGRRGERRLATASRACDGRDGGRQLSCFVLIRPVHHHSGFLEACSFPFHGVGPATSPQPPFSSSSAPPPSSPLHHTSFSPVRFSGHILCSFPQVRTCASPSLLECADHGCYSFGVTTQSRTLQKFDIFDSVSRPIHSLHFLPF
jgi:hypothetical protein